MNKKVENLDQIKIRITFINRKKRKKRNIIFTMQTQLSFLTVKNKNEKNECLLSHQILLSQCEIYAEALTFFRQSMGG